MTTCSACLHEQGAASKKKSVNDSSDEDDDDYEPRGKTKSTSRSTRSASAPAVNLDGEIISADNMLKMVGVCIQGRQTLSMKKVEGEVRSVWAEGDKKDSIYCTVLWDSMEHDQRFKLVGPGRCAYWSLPPEQLPLARRAGCQAVSAQFGNGPPPLSKIDERSMVPMLILPCVSNLGNTALKKALGCVHSRYITVLYAI